MNRLTVKDFLTQVLFIFALSAVLGFGTNIRLIRQYLGGEFQYGYISKEEFPSISFIVLPEAERLFAGNQSLFIDSRDADSYKTGHIAGAINIPFEEKGDVSLLDELSVPKEKTVIVYCDGSECQSSLGLAQVLDGKGFLNIRVFFGGWKEWEREGLPMETGDER